MDSSVVDVSSVDVKVTADEHGLVNGFSMGTKGGDITPSIAHVEKPTIRQNSDKSGASTPSHRSSFLIPAEALGGDFELSVLTFTDPVDFSQGNPDSLDIDQRLLSHDGKAAAIIQLEEISQRAFNRRVAVS